MRILSRKGPPDPVINPSFTQGRFRVPPNFSYFVFATMQDKCDYCGETGNLFTYKTIVMVNQMPALYDYYAKLCSKCKKTLNVEKHLRPPWEALNTAEPEILSLSSEVVL